MKDTPFASLDDLSHRLGLSSAWLKDETNAGRIPVLVINDRRYYHFATVEQSLVDRMKQPASSNPPGDTAMDRLLINCDIPERAIRELNNLGVNTLGDLLAWSPTSLRRVRGIGRTTLRAIARFVDEAGFQLGKPMRAAPTSDAAPDDNAEVVGKWPDVSQQLMDEHPRSSASQSPAMVAGNAP